MFHARTLADVESYFPHVPLHKTILRSDPAAGPPSNSSMFSVCISHGQGARDNSEVAEGERGGPGGTAAVGMPKIGK